MQTIPVPVQLFQSIGAYLAEQKYRDVAALLNGMQSAAEAVQSRPAGDAQGKTAEQFVAEQAPA